MSRLYRLAKPFLFALDAERAHGLSHVALKRGPGVAPPPGDLRLRQTLMGLDFPNPLGMAAGFDKNAEVFEEVLGLGFGFVEVGTVTPLPQAGNPKPRVFRLPDDGAILNRLGFNNQGHAAAHARLAVRRRRGVVGVNVGAGRDSTDRAGDYAAGVTRFAGVADYIAINVSSPNTPGLRDLQERSALAALLDRAVAARDATGRRPPLLLKIAPDLDDAALAAIVDAALAARVEGMIVSNTTVSRDGLRDPRYATEAGGISGRPLFARSTAMLAKVRRQAGKKLVLVGVGGIDSAETAWAKIAAGANLLQLYTGLVYEGPGLVADILAGLPQLALRHGFRTVAEACGSETERYAAGA